MKKRFFYLLILISSFLTVNPYKAEIPNAINFERKIQQEDTCSLTVNFYSGGQLVGTQTYTGYPCGIFGQDNCKQWRQDMLKMINQQVAETGTMMPGGGGFSC